MSGRRRAAVLVGLGAVCAVSAGVTVHPPSPVLGVGAGVLTVAAAVAIGLVVAAALAPAPPPHGRRLAPGERAQGLAVLAPLERQGFVVLSDRRVPGGRAPVDHVIVGPTGVWLVRSEHRSGTVSIRDGRVDHDGRSLRTLLAEHRRAARAVRRLVMRHPTVATSAVHPVAWIHGAAVERAWGTGRRVDGVHVCSTRTMARRITTAEPVIDHVVAARLAALLDRCLPVASPPTRSRPAHG